MDRMPDTPPDGDFARYVEQLSARSAATAQARETAAVVPTGKLELKAVEGAPPSPEPAGVISGLSVWSIVRWALLAWIALQILDVFFPGMGMLSLPLFLGAAGWAVYRLKQGSSGAPGDALRRLAERAAKEFTQRK
ncbi:MAG: hypothetical protein H0W47_13700 [Polaromonas sp.]|uniref:hypothetical protein n=1 Tax=Polaromonas sp. TaxID=1869339 RepID=UPI0018527DA7|nr:hypothetical protein [Polaromonas sp.]MBA3594831.1 hypothetical protein [Polaromonas sp.]